jgi:hypothetical protein
MPEVWRPIAGFEGYSASSLGRIRNDKTERILTLTRTSKYLNAWVAGEKRYAHTLVALAFHGERPGGMVCCHANDDGQDNRAENLYWGTAKQNMADARKNRRIPLGTARRGTRLTEAQVVQIRARLANGDSQQSIANAFGIDQGTISRINTGKAWAHA